MTTCEFAPEQGQPGGQRMLYKLHATQACNYPCKKLMCWGVQQIHEELQKWPWWTEQLLIFALKRTLITGCDA